MSKAKKAIKRFAVMVLAVVLILPATFAQYIPIAFGEGEGAPVDVTQFLTNKVINVEQPKDTIIPDGGTLDLTDPLSIEVGFGIPVLGDDPEPANPVRHGDWARFTIGKGINLSASSSSSQELKASIGGEIKTIGHVSIKEDPDGTVYFEIVFDGDSDLFEEGSLYHDLECRAWFDFDIDATQNPNPGQDFELILINKTFEVSVPQPVEEYRIEKSGKTNIDEKQVDWEVDLKKLSDNVSAPLSAGQSFVDNLKNVGEYVEGSFKVNGVSETPTYNSETGELRYEFPDSMSAAQLTDPKITFATKIADSALYQPGTVVINNTAMLVEGSGTKLAEDTAQVSFVPEWIKKSSEVKDGWLENGNYSPLDRTVTWTIIANQLEATLPNAIINDQIPSGLAFDTATLQLWDAVAQDWATAQSITPDLQGDYILGNINTKVLLTIVTKVPDADWVTGTTTYRNTANLRWSGGPGEGIGSNQATAVVGYNAIQKSGVLDKKTNTIIWTVSVDYKGQDIPNTVVYDVLAYGKSLNLTQVGIIGVPSNIAPSDLTVRYSQKYDGGFTSVSGGPLSLLPSKIELDGSEVADLLTITGFSKDEKNTFTFKSLITNPEVFGKNGTTTLSNTATLFSGNTKLNTATATVQYASNVIAKQMLKREEVSQVAPNPNNLVSSLDQGFDYVEKAAIFRLVVNANGGNLSQAQDGTTGSGTLMGTVTVVDTLPAGWEFDAIESQDYLIYSAQGGVGGVAETSLASPNPVSTLAKGTDSSGSQTITFTFDNLDKSYVILIKAKITDETAAEYFSKNATITKKNNVTLSVGPNNLIESRADQDVRITSQVFDKLITRLEAGVLRYSVRYQPYEAGDLGYKIVDTIPQGLELRTDAQGGLLTSGDEVAIFKLTLQSDGTYVKGNQVPVVTNREDSQNYNVSWDAVSRQLEFIFPDQGQGYVLEYTADITAEGGAVSNSATLFGNDESTIDEQAEYSVQTSDQESSLKIGNVLLVTKIDCESGETLKGMTATLYAVDEEGNANGTVVRQVTTGDNGTVRIKNLPVGTYVLEETQAPNDYYLGPEVTRAHSVVVTVDDTGKFTVSIDSGENNVVFKNFSTLSETSVYASKQWEGDKENERKTRPESITVRLFADGEEVEGSERLVSPNQEGIWETLYENLAKYSEESTKPIEYTVVENPVKNYLSSSTSLVNEEGVTEVQIINTYVGTNVLISKQWQGDEGKIRPASITVHLLANGKEVERGTRTIEPNSEGKWETLFENLPKYLEEDSVPIEYTVVEDGVANYSSAFTVETDEEEMEVVISLENTYQEPKPLNGYTAATGDSLGILKTVLITLASLAGIIMVVWLTHWLRRRYLHKQK